MTLEAEPRPALAASFSPRTILALVLIGIVAFSGLSVLAVYAPDLRGGSDGGAHALSSSAVGFRGATILLQGLDIPVEVNRSPPAGRRIGEGKLLVLTPRTATQAVELQAFPNAQRILVVMPKWLAFPDPDRPPFVRKVAVLTDRGWAKTMLSPFAATTALSHRTGWSRPVLNGVRGTIDPTTVLKLGRIDQLQTLDASADWIPGLTDETGRTVLAHSRTHPGIWVLSDPDLLNNQGLAQLDNARAGAWLLSGFKNGVVFDVTLAGFARGRSIGKLMLEPPWLAATLCAVAAAVLMFFHALARFGPAHERGRAIALGAGALVDNSAGLVRMARKEAALAPQYVELAKALVTRAAGAGRAGTEADHETWLAGLAHRRGLAAPEDLTAEAMRARTRDDVAALGAKLYRWRREMTREGG